MITWTTEFETGSAKLDRQHRLLIDNINLLKDLLDTPDLANEEQEFSFFLVSYLETYSNLHFREEERCMEAYRCPVHALDQQQHEVFRGVIRDYKRRREVEGFNVELLRNLHRFMRTWILDHILKIDAQLKSSIQMHHEI